ncbi:hypothetical protein [Novipirellula artificiosorum]|nr:hypothetical protein [Novipirellula artificiosorum]
MMRLVTTMTFTLFAFMSVTGRGEPLSSLPPGTVLDQANVTPWNRLVLVATPRIASGDVDAISESIRSAVSTFRLTIMARVTNDPQTERHRLADVGIGYSVPVNGKLTVIDSQNTSDLDVSLGFIQKRVLSQSEAHLQKVSVLVRTSTLVVFDVPSIFHRSGKHRDYLNRNLIWIRPESGEVAMASWLVDRSAKPPRPSLSDPLRIIAAATREDRRIHVDEDAFFLGIPNERGFALENLPPGKDVAWNDELRDLMCRDSYHAQSIGLLASAINRACAENASERKP